MRQIYNGIDSGRGGGGGGVRGRGPTREKQSCGEKAPAPVGFRSV